MMSLPVSVDHARGGRFNVLSLALFVLVGGALGVAAAYQVMTGSLIAALCLVPYLGLLCAVWWLSRGNVLILVLAAYLIAPSPADNLLPQVFIYASTDYALRARDLLFLADLVLIGALLLIRPPLPESRLGRLWLGALALLAGYPVIVGLVAGAGQSVPAVFQGAVMPLRGIGVVILVAWWAKAKGWDAAVRDLARTAVICSVLIAIVEVVLVVMAQGEPNYSLFNYPLVTDGRPAVPGWGNNILANLFCTCIAIIAFIGHRLGWKLHWRVLSAVLLLVGLEYTKIRIAMIIAVLVIETPVILAVVRKLWPRRGAVVAVVTGGVLGVVLALATVTLLFMMNPRFNTLVPGFIEQHITSAESGAGPTELPAGGADDDGAASISTRVALLNAAMHVWRINPVVGAGWNGWGWAKSDSDLGEYQQVVGVDPHNGFTWLLADAGVLGLLLLYLLPVILTFRRWDLWWLLAVPSVATALEMVNPNLRNGHFAVLVWAFLALAFAATPPAHRYTFTQWIRDAWNWLRGREVQRVGATVQSKTDAVAEPDRQPETERDVPARSSGASVIDSGASVR